MPFLSKRDRERLEEQRRERVRERYFEVALGLSIFNVVGYWYFNEFGPPLWFHHPGYVLLHCSPLGFILIGMLGCGLGSLIHRRMLDDKSGLGWMVWTFFFYHLAIALAHAWAVYRLWA